MRRIIAISGLTIIMLYQMVPCVLATGETSPEGIPFDDEHWTLQGEVVEHLGQSAVRGGAVLKGVVFTDGVIEFDMAVTEQRGFPGVAFRMQDDANTEIFYIRPHSPNKPDALQYAAVFNGITGWQLGNGPGYTTASDIPHGEWLHVKLEVAGSQARAYFRDMDRVALRIPHLEHGAGGGGIALRGAPGGAVHFANFRFVARDDLDLGPTPIRAEREGRIVDWELSHLMRTTDINRYVAPSSQDLGEVDWQSVTSEADGVVNIARYVQKSRQEVGVVVARATIVSEDPRRSHLRFGYSDEVSLFLNGELVFSGDAAFRSRSESFLGAVSFNDGVILNLDSGANTLEAVVAEAMGGWAIGGQLTPLSAEAVGTMGGIRHDWTLSEGLANPESAVVDVARGAVYVSNFNAAQMRAGATGFVSRLSLSGEVLDNPWVEGLAAPTGLALVAEGLLVVERSGLAVIDPDSGMIVRRIAIPARGFLNDVAVSPDGTIYVSDSRGGVIFRVRGDQPEEWFSGPPLDRPNGLSADRERVVAGNSGNGDLVILDRATAKVEAIIDIGDAAIDAVESDGRGNFVVSLLDARVLEVSPNGATRLMIDTRAHGVIPADLTLDSKAGVMVIPSLYSNQVDFYRVESPVAAADRP